MKAILVIDVPMLDDGRHLCNECPIWNRDRFLCEYGFNTEAKGCPLKPMPMEFTVEKLSEEEQDSTKLVTNMATMKVFADGYNACLEEINK